MKKTAYIAIAICLCAVFLTPRTNASTSVSINGGYIRVDSSSLSPNRWYFYTNGLSTDSATALATLTGCTNISCPNFSSGNGYTPAYNFPGFSGVSSYYPSGSGYVGFAIDNASTTYDITNAPVKGYFYWNGSTISELTLISGGIPTQDTRWITPYTPYTGTLSATTSITFQAAYYFNDVTSFGLYNTVGFIVKDLTNGTGGTVGTSSISSSGYATSSFSTILTPDHSYLWRPTMYSNNGSSTPLNGEWYSLTASSSAQYTPYTPAGANTVSTSSLPDVTNLISFLNVPELLATKIPFAYIFQIKTGIEQGISSSSADTIPSGTFTYRGLNGATSTIDMFSTSTIGVYITPTMVSLWRGFLLIILYAEFGYALYHRAKSKHLI